MGNPQKTGSKFVYNLARNFKTKDVLRILVFIGLNKKLTS